MKQLKNAILTILFFSIISNFIFSQDINQSKGQNLCDSMFLFIEKNGFSPQLQPLVAGGSNSLPYNIIVRFSPKDTPSENNLILFFYMEDLAQNKELLIPILNALKEKNYNSTLVLSPGNRKFLEKDNIIYGSQVFTQSLDTNIQNSAILFDLSSRKNAILTGSNKKHSPSWMLKDMFDAYSDAHITDDLPLIFISQVADFSFSEDPVFLAFAETNIPCICAGIKDKTKVEKVILSLIDSYEKSGFEQNDDSHSFMFRFFGKRIWLSELRLIKLLIIFLILAIILVFCLSFINKNLKVEFWQEIKANWYVLPVIFLLTLAGFFLGKWLYILLIPQAAANYTVYGFIILQIMISLLLVSGFFMLNLSLLKKYTTRSLDFLLVLDTFINLVIFSLLDISLFPIFILIYIVSVISLIFRRNWIHIILFVFLIIPFVPYINALFNTSDISKLHNLLIHSLAQPFLMSFILLPLYLMFLRLFNALKKYYTKKRLYALVISITYILVFLLLVLLNRIFYSGKKGNDKNLQIQVINDSNEIKDPAFDFALSYKDKNIFEDTIRSVYIDCKELPVYVSFSVQGSDPELSPVLYSENDFTLLQANHIFFPLPLYPSKNLEFNYGSSFNSQTISAEIIFSAIDSSTGEEKYYSLTKSLFIEGKDGRG